MEAATKLSLGMLGLAVMSLVLFHPPEWFSNTYFLAISVVFFTGVAQLNIAVWELSTGRCAAWIRSLLVCVATVLIAAAGLSVAYHIRW